MIKRSDVLFRHAVGRVQVDEVEIGDFILIDIGPDRSPNSGFYSEVTQIAYTGGHVAMLTDEVEVVRRSQDRITYLRKVK